MDISLNDIKNHYDKKKYKYKNIHFLTSTTKKNFLVVGFHGMASYSCYPVFRGYNYNFKNANMLSISDPLHSYYKNIKIGWYLNTKKYSNTVKHILEIVKHIQNITDATDIIFISNCSGGIIASRLACMTNQYALIANPHTIVKSDDNWIHYHWNDQSLECGYRMPLVKKDNFKKVPVTNSILKKHNDEVLDISDLDIRSYMKKYGFPKQIRAYTHINDYTAEWLNALSNFYKTYENNTLHIIFNNNKVRSPHHSPFNNTNLQTETQKFIDDIISENI
jgi:hypothetical protein